MLRYVVEIIKIFKNLFYSYSFDTLHVECLTKTDFKWLFVDAIRADGTQASNSASHLHLQDMWTKPSGSYQGTREVKKILRRKRTK